MATDARWDVLSVLPIPNVVYSLLSLPRLGQFGTVGVVGVAVDNTVLAILVELGGWRLLLAKLLAAEAAIIVMFACNERWTFEPYGDRSLVPTLWRFVRSNTVRVGGISVAVGTLFVMHTYVGVWYVLANLIGIGFGFILNYTLESLYTWRVQNG